MRKSKKNEVEFVYCMASQVLVFEFVNMHGTLALCVEFPLVACVGGISTITTHASHLIKTPTMYVINIVLYILSVYIYIYIYIFIIQLAIQLFIIFIILIQRQYIIICLLNTLLLIIERKWLKIIINHSNT